MAEQLREFAITLARWEVSFVDVLSIYGWSSRNLDGEILTHTTEAATAVGPEVALFPPTRIDLRSEVLDLSGDCFSLLAALALFWFGFHFDLIWFVLCGDRDRFVALIFNWWSFWIEWKAGPWPHILKLQVALCDCQRAEVVVSSLRRNGQVLRALPPCGDCISVRI